MFITYEGDGEVITTTDVDEPQMLREYFAPHGDRLRIEYTRQVWADSCAVVVASRLRVE